jgi:hypothetical protein
LANEVAALRDDPPLPTALTVEIYDPAGSALYV